MSGSETRAHPIWWLYLLAILALLPFGFGARTRTVAATAAAITFVMSLHERTAPLARLPLAAIALWIGVEQGRGPGAEDAWLALLHVLFLAFVTAAVGYAYLPWESRRFGLLLLQSAGLGWNGFLIGRTPLLGATLLALLLGVLLLLGSVGEAD